MNSGIYAIVNKINGKLYYGSTLNFKTRKNDHFKTLRSQSHRNPHLQHAFNKYGNNAFEFIIVEYVQPDDLLIVEQKYLDANIGGYNIAVNAEASRRGIPCSNITRQKISNSLKGKKQSLETRTKKSHSCRAAHQGKGYWYSKRDKKYCVNISYLNKKYSLGAYTLEEDAKEVVKRFMQDTQNMTIENKIKGNTLGSSALNKGKGYFYRKDIDKYVARITINSRRFQIGKFGTEDEAKTAVKEARESLQL